ncbi:MULTISPECIES: hypothetical protein [Lelliottia]|uniref:Bacterial Ig-like domain-containing protein n=1 Tax=Lelliottia aquatilis TaxID=2080838 RepID=A0ABX5A1T2_9ENTR|nr:MULTISPECIES: hypothetical protein [Lelliottia]POZ13818.1 hypothetical protein C3Z09_21570 [Lelliottia aquatilis]POZ19158.1 hypothetical protein C3708_16470 [Lelliottia sp. 7254-16]POZ22023.1 hypothetical protein C3712_14495 [Lelliottia aquatilis]POZ24637.1 hypothetical protein C3711_15240 [Lelliottia aquatilis]POZ30586.1 hypothetical protein C3710_22310 [Lelliottia aquatilis]
MSQYYKYLAGLLLIVSGGVSASTLHPDGKAPHIPRQNFEADYNVEFYNASNYLPVTIEPLDNTCMKNPGDAPFTINPHKTHIFSLKDNDNLFYHCLDKPKKVKWVIQNKGNPTIEFDHHRRTGEGVWGTIINTSSSLVDSASCDNVNCLNIFVPTHEKVPSIKISLRGTQQARKLTIATPVNNNVYHVSEILTPSGTGQPDATVTYSFSGCTPEDNAWCQPTAVSVNSSGDWYGDDITLTHPGDLKLQAQQSYSGNSIDSASAGFSVVPSEIPTTSLFTFDTPKEGAHYAASDYITPSGQVNNGSTVQYQIDGDNTFFKTTVSDNKWAGNPAQYPPGNHTITAQLTTKPGSSLHEVITRHFMVDPAPVVIEFPANNQWLPFADTLTVTGKASPSATIVCQMDETPTDLSYLVTKEGNFSCPLNIKGVTGKHSVTVAQKFNGQPFGQDRHDFYVTRALTITDPVEGGSVHENTQFPIKGEGEPGFDVQVVMNFYATWHTTVNASGHWSIYGPRSSRGAYVYTATESKYGTDVNNTACRTIKVISPHSYKQNTFTDFCSEATGMKKEDK